MPHKVRFFRTATTFRAWLLAHHAEAQELWVGFYKKGSGKRGITYGEALEEALCFGWIDGRLQRLDDERYQQRFTPRRRGSQWSTVNIRRVEGLIARARMHPAGLAAFEARRDRDAPAPYSHEHRQKPIGLVASYEARFRAQPAAWAFFETQPPWYRRNTQWWVMSAKKEDTRERRLVALIEACHAGERLGQFTLAGTRKPKLGK